MIAVSDDLGPAPLQFVGNIIDEYHSSIVNPNDLGNTKAAEMALLNVAVEAAQKRLSNKKNETSVKDTRDDDSSNNHDNIETSDTTIFTNNEVFTHGCFVNMDTHPWAWTKAFLLMFTPVFARTGGILGCHITHDYTGWNTVWDHTVRFTNWAEYISWADDGRFASHLTIALVVFNHQMKQKVNG